MLRFVTTRGHANTLAALPDARAGLRVETLGYDQLFASKWLRPATYVFTDLDRLGAWDLELASAVYRRLVAHGLLVLNDPARVRNRHALLRTLHHRKINTFNAYRVDELRRPERYPVFVRRGAGHKFPLSDLLHDWKAVQHAIEMAIGDGIPERNLLIIEYAAQPVRPRVFRKLAVIRVGDRIVPQPSVHDDQWVVKYGQLGVADEVLYEDEAAIMAEGRYDEVLMSAFEAANIEYGRADFGLVDGRPQIYEINTNPMLKWGRSHPSARRLQTTRACWTSLLAALCDIDRGQGGWPVRIRDPRLTRHQMLRGRLIRSRWAQ